MNCARINGMTLCSSAGYLNAINGAWSLAADFTTAMESLTKRQGLSRLTLLNWPALPRKGTMRPMRAWCSACLVEWRSTGKPIYEPLLWAIRIVNVCPYHRGTLSWICPSCRRQNGVLDARLWPGRCSRCFQWLGEEKRSNETSPDEWRLWAAIQLGELLATNSRTPTPPTVESPDQILISILSRMDRVVIKKVCNLLQVESYEFGVWRKRNSLSSFSVLLKMCYVFNFSLLDLFCGRVPSAPARIVRDTPEQFGSKPKPRRRSDSFNAEECERALQIALEEDPPVSVNQVLGRLGIVKNGYPSRLFPELCNAVAKRYSEFRKSRIAEKRKKAIAEVKRVALEMHATGILLHYRKICPRLSLGGMYLPDGRAAFRQIKEELGVELR
jgi:TniQ